MSRETVIAAVKKQMEGVSVEKQWNGTANVKARISLRGISIEAATKASASIHNALQEVIDTIGGEA